MSTTFHIDDKSQSDNENKNSVSPPAKKQRITKGRPVPVHCKMGEKRFTPARPSPAGYTCQSVFCSLQETSFTQPFLSFSSIMMLQKRLRERTSHIPCRREATTSKFQLLTCVCLLAILFISGYAPLRWCRLYWESNDDDVQNVAVSQVMTRKQFDDKMQFL